MKNLSTYIDENFYKNVGIHYFANSICGDSGRDMYMPRPVGGDDKRKSYHIEAKNDWTISVSNVKGISISKRAFDIDFSSQRSHIDKLFSDGDYKDIYFALIPGPYFNSTAEDFVRVRIMNTRTWHEKWFKYYINTGDLIKD